MISIIIPVYKGYEETKSCVESVLNSNCVIDFRVIIINDCSPENAVVDYLNSLEDSERLIVLHNKKNEGFVRTVNIGMETAGEDDVLLLNSDAVVANDWLDRISSAAKSDSKIATVTPFSNNATICSYPLFCQDNILPAGETLESLDLIFSEANRGGVYDIPTAIGFCMYIKRESINDIGLFDVETFGKGYGEENDFCMRAYKSGWRNVLAADVYVYHAGGVSFAGEQDERKKIAESELRKLHPEYDALVADFVSKDEIKKFRMSATALRYRLSKKNKLLYIIHGLGGGVETHINDLIFTIKEKCHVFILRPGSNSNEVFLKSADSDIGEISLTTGIDYESKTLLSILEYLAIDRVHVHIF